MNLASPLRQLALAALLMLTGCSMEDFSSSQKTLRSADGFSIVSEQRSYANPSTGMSTHHGEYHFRINGKRVDPDILGAALFPEKSRCHSPFYRVSDLRLLPDNAVLAIFSITNAQCELGNIVMARISAREGKLGVERLLIADDTARIINGTFIVRRGDALSRTSNEHAPRLIEQSDQNLPQIFLEAEPLGDGERLTRMIRLDLGSLAQIDLGKGSVMRFVGADSLLMLDIPWQNKRPVAKVRLVRVSDGQTLAFQSLRIACLRPAGSEANYRALFQLSMLEQEIQIRAQREAIATGKEVTIPDPLGITDFNQDKLPPLAMDAANFAVGETLRTSLLARIVDDKIELDIGQQLRPVKNCQP